MTGRIIASAYWLMPLLVLVQQALAQSASTTQPDTSAPTAEAPKYNGGEDNPQDPSDAGAAGSSKGAFDLSKGGLAAIIIVCVLVVVLGIGSAVLFWLAKKRQWHVRQSIRRASRRMTGRSTADLPSTNKRQNRRTGIKLDPPPQRKARTKQQQGQEKDIEKALEGGHGKNTTKITSTFDVDTPTPKPKGWTGGLMGKK